MNQAAFPSAFSSTNVKRLPYCFSAGIRQLLQATKNQFNEDLVKKYLEADPRIETQANIRNDVGIAKTKKLPDGRTVKYRAHDGWEFKAIRYPYRAMDEPDWDNDPGCSYPFDEYLQAIGTTWFAKSGSLRWGYDVDAVWGHKGPRGLSEAQLEAIKGAVASVDYVELRRSTHGRGLHLYVLASGIELANHTEHAAAARAALGKLCFDAGLDFASQVDCLGGNMWIWSRDATVENRGFELLKPATRALTPDDLPANWRHHIAVIQRKRPRIAVPDGKEDRWVEFATETTADDGHRRIFKAYQQTGYVLTQNPDIGCWYGHTAGFDKVHKALGLYGSIRITSF